MVDLRLCNTPMTATNCLAAMGRGSILFDSLKKIGIEILYLLNFTTIFDNLKSYVGYVPQCTKFQVKVSRASGV